jgi:hypothetical protein
VQHFTASSKEDTDFKSAIVISNPYHLSNVKGYEDRQYGTLTASARGTLNRRAGYITQFAWYATDKIRDLYFADYMYLVRNGASVRNLYSGIRLRHGSDER